jgi:hypothetical protein
LCFVQGRFPVPPNPSRPIAPLSSRYGEGVCAQGHVSPLAGLQLFTLGKLEWHQQHTVEAVRALTAARPVLEATHGRDTALVRELAMLLGQAQAELAELKG